MEVDERFRWLEDRVSSSLRPRGEDLRRMTVDEHNRVTFLSFCNHSESRCIFVHVVRTDAGDGEVIKVSSSPPSRVNDKAMVFLKCSHASKLTRENLAQDVIYSEYSTSPLEHLDLVMQEVYLPLMTPSTGSHTHTNDKLLDLLHRISSSMQVTNGYSQGKVVLPLPSVATLAQTAFTSPDRHSVVVHVLETAVVTWMKQVKMALHCDPTGAISRKAGKYSGPLEEIKFWEARQQRLESVREQLSSIPILTILHNLELMHSTYAQGFSHAQHNIAQAAQEAEHCLGFLRTWKPWLVRLHDAQHPSTIATSFPPIMAVLLLIWQHSGYYGQKPALHRLLTLLANEVVTKTRDIVGCDLLGNPTKSLSDLKLALRVCAAFRGCYLDYKQRADTWLKTEVSAGQVTGSAVSTGGKGSVQETHCGWPLRNSKVFHAMNTIMERCNDLMELVHTIRDFSELSLVGEVNEGGRGITTTEVVIGDIHSKFTEAVQVFSSGKQDLLSVGGEGHFESQFFAFRRKVQELEGQLGREIGAWLQRSPSLQAKLRIMELFQWSSHRDTVRAILSPHHESVMTTILSDIQDVLHVLTSSQPPLLPHTPPTATRLLWLHGLEERTSGAVSVLRSAAPQLLEGELGWKLRQTYSELTEKLNSFREEEERKWVDGVPSGLSQRLSEMVLRRGPDGELVVNFDQTLHQVLCEARHLSHPPLSLRMPPAIKVLTKTVNLEELRDRRASLELVLQVHRDTLAAMSEEERLLLLGKLQHIQTLLSEEEEKVNWLSPQFPDFLAKIKMAICTDLCSSLSALHAFSSSLSQVTSSWSQVSGLDIFARDGENTPEGLQNKHCAVIERLNSLLPSSMSRLHSHLASVQAEVHASPESPAWDQFLQVTEHQVTEGLVSMILTAVGSLLHRAQLYEQGVSIPPLMPVRLELVGSTVMFSPPLTPHSSLASIPETVASWMDSYVATTRHLPRILPGSKENYQDLLSSDPRVRGALGKVTAHLESNSRQAQNLRSKFSQFSFLWEHDVQQTFRAFLAGEAPPHPKRLSRPETVRSRGSARPHSSGSTRPKSSQVSISQYNLPAPAPAMNVVMGVSDWDFLCPPGMEPGPDEDISKRPSLEEFDGELAIFQGISERLNRIEDDCNVGWLTANQRPIKDILMTLVSKWKAVYAGYLERQMSQMLNSLDQFLHEVEPHVDRMGLEGEHSISLMDLMTIFNRVNGQQMEMDKKFGTVHRAFVMLDKFSHPLPQGLRDQFSSAPHRWSILKKRISLGKQRMGPSIQFQSETITADLAGFGRRYSTLHEKFEGSECLRRDCRPEVAREVVKKVERELRDLQCEALNLIELQELLGTSVFNFSLLNEFQEELSTLSELWGFFESVKREHSVWQESEWRLVECQEVAEVTQQQLTSLQALPPFTQSWDIYQHLDAFLHAILLTLPLVEGLRGSAIRPRHWKQVLRLACQSSLATLQLVSRGGGLDNCALENLSLCQLMSLELHKHSSEVLGTVDRANKEVAIEALLNTFEEVWLSRQLELVAPQRQPLTISRQETVTELGLEGQIAPATSKPRVSSAKVTSLLQRSRRSVTKPTSPTPFSPPSPSSPPDTSHQTVRLLCNTDSIFETLESHQTSLQSVIGTAAAASFTDDLHRWQKMLQTIEAVLGVWLQVQALWTQLEVYQSSEVQTHLPAQSFTFSSVDKDWRDLIQSATVNPSVMTVCLKEGLLCQLEKLQTSLLQCRAALVGYAKGQRDKCHWFHFIPLDDVLQFVCCGSRVDQLSSLIHKLLPHASGLLYTHNPPSTLPLSPSSPSTPHLPRITGVIGHLGERLELQQSVACFGTMESIIASLFSSTRSTLRSQLSSAMASHVLPTPSSSPLSLLPSLWYSGHSTQIILLVTQISLDAALETSLQRTAETGEGIPMEALCEEMQELVTKAVRMLQVYPEQGQSVVSGGEPDPENVLEGHQGSSVTRDQANRLRSIVLVLSSALQRGVQYLQQTAGQESGTDFLQDGRLRWVWSEDNAAVNEEPCHLTTLGARVSYGYHYVGGGSRLVLTPATERALIFLLRGVHQGHHSLLTGPEASGKRSVVAEVAAMTGQPFFSLHCTPHTSSCTLINCLQGTALTGCWLLLQSVDSLSLAALHTVSVLLPQLQLARRTRASSLPWLGAQPLSLPPGVTPGVCFGTTFSPSTTTAKLSPELRRVFVTFSVTRPEQRILVEAFLLAHQFHNHRRLTRTLDTLLTAADELFNNKALVDGEGESKTVKIARDTGSVRPLLPLGLGVLEAVVSSGRRYMAEFERLGVLQWSGGGGGGGGPLGDRSLVLSDVSEGARASMRLRASSVDQTQEPALVRGSLEELCLLLSLKDHLLPQFQDAASLDTFLLLLSDLFPSCNVPELLAHERGQREELASRVNQDREEAGNSARESRAASAMMVVREDMKAPSEVMTSQEEQIVQACLLDNLVPSPSLQLTVSQLLSLTRSHMVVAIVGGVCSGKSTVIKVAANTLRGQGAGLTLSWIFPGALDEGQLFGQELEERWQEGLLPQLVTRSREDGRGGVGGQGGEGGSGAKWVILDGPLSPHKLETLLTLNDSDRLIKLSNGRGIPIDSSYRFILELTCLDSFTPRASASLPRLCLSPSTVSWWDSVSHWLLTQPRERASTLEPHLQRLLPPCLEFLAPVLLGGETRSREVSTSSLSGGTQLRLFPQDLRLHPVHLVTTCCTILEVSLSVCSTTPRPEELLPHLAYSLIWSMGGHLSHTNKLIFDYWWRHSFTDLGGLTHPTPGLIWDYCPDPGTPGIVPCFSTHLALSSSPSPGFKADSPAPFVTTSRADAVAHVVQRLVRQGSPVLLVGALGSGKTAVLQQILSKTISNDVTLQHYYASQFTTGQSFWSCLKEQLEWKWGRNFAPQGSGCRRLVCFLDDLHNSAPAGSLGEMVRCHLTTGGVWEGGVCESQRWHHVANTSYVCTASSDVGERRLDLRLARHFTVLHWDGYDSSELETIFSTILSPHLSPTSGAGAGVGEVGERLVQMAVQVHSRLSPLFLPSPRRQHYLFNLRHIAGIFRQLCRWCSEERVVSARGLVQAWQRESWWTYSGALSSKVDRERYQEVVSHALRKHFCQSNLLPELLQPGSHQLTCSERETLCRQLQQQLTHHPGLHINLYDTVLEEINRLCQLIRSPFDLSHVVLVGHAHPDPLVQLAAAHCGYTVVRPSLYFSSSLVATSCSPFGMSPASYNEESLRNNLCTLYTEAGVKNQQMLLLVTSVEMLHVSFLGLLHEAVCNGHITHLFPREERTRIVSAVRSSVTRAGIAFSPTAAWQFFLSRVRQNLRIVLATPDLRPQGDTPLDVHWIEFLSRVNIHYQQPWTQRDLVDVALHHLNAMSVLSPSLRESCAHMLAAIHLQLRAKQGLLPAYNSTFQYLVNWFVEKLQESHNCQEGQSAQLRQAMECVEKARERAGVVEERLVREERVLEERDEAYRKVLVQLGQDTAISEEQSRLVARQRHRVSDLRKVIPQYELGLQMAGEEKLSLVLHLKRQVMNINHSSLTELRAQQRPQQLIEDLMSAVISIVKSPSADLSWTKGAKRLMANIDRFHELLLGKSQSESDSVTILKSVEPIINRVAPSVDELGSYPGGLAAMQLLEWAQGVVKLHSLLETRVRPLEEKMAAMSSSLAECEDKLRQQEDKMNVLGKRVQGLSEGLESAAVQCSLQRDTVQQMKKQLRNIQDFVGILAGDYERRREQLNTADNALTQELGPLAISACIPVYLASLPPHVQMYTLHTLLLPLLRERGVPVAWGGQQLPTVVGSFCQPQTSDFSSSYPALCRGVLPRVSSPSFRTQWLEKGHSFTAVLYMSLAALSWRRALLIHDPEDFVSRWLRSWKGEELVVVDYRERDFKFYLAIEQALLCGDPLLVEGVATPIDPSLQPLLEMVHSWSKSEQNPVQFCGRKIVANPGFSLFLTTALPLSSFPPTLTCITCPLDFSPSQPWARELLFKTACCVTDSSPDQFDKMVCELVKVEQKVEELKGRLPSLLCNSRHDDCCSLTQRVASTIENCKQAEEAYATLKTKLDGYTATKSHLTSLAHTSSLVFDLLVQCSPHQTPVVSLSLFRHHLSTALRGSEETDGETEVLGGLASALQATAEVLGAAAAVSEAEREERQEREGEWRAGVLQELMLAAVKDMACVLKPSQCVALCCALSILATVPPHTPPSLLLEQLSFLVEGREGYLVCPVDEVSSLPSCPASIPRDLWISLHVAPFSPSYFSRHVAPSTHSDSDREFWAGIQQGGGRRISKFPWRKDRRGPETLDDLVMLTLLHRSAALEVIGEATARLTDSVRSRPLTQLVSAPEGGDRGKPLLLVNDEDELESELNMLLLQDELQRISGEKPVRVMNIAAATVMEGNCISLKEDVSATAATLLVTGLGHCHTKWLPLTTAKMQHVCARGGVVVAVVEGDSPALTMLSISCRVARLSHLAIPPPPSGSTPTPLLGPNRILLDLLHLLTSLPHLPSSPTSQLSPSSHPLLFHLSLLHCSLHHYCQLSERPTPPFPLFTSSLSLLPTSTQDRDQLLADTVAALRHHTLALYGPVCSGPVLEGMVASCLDLSALETPGAKLTLALGEYGELEVVTPGPGVPLENYGDHVMGMMSSETHQRTDTILSKQTLSSAVTDLLVPMLTKILDTPSPLSGSPNPLTASSLSPLSHRHTKTLARSPSKQQLKQTQPPLSTNTTTSATSDRTQGTRRDSMRGGIKVEGAEVCSQLPSSHAYHDYIWRRATDSVL